MSLSPKGMPWRCPRGRPAAISASAWRPWRRARSHVGVMNERSWPSRASARAISASASSTGDSFRAAISRDSSMSESSCRSATAAAPERAPGLAVDVDQHRIRDVTDVDRAHEGELRGERLPGQRVLLGPLEPERDGEPPELLHVLLGEPNHLHAVGLVLLPGRDVLLLNVGVVIPRVLPG